MLFVLTTALLVNAKVIDNSDFSIDIPSTWNFEPTAPSYPISNILTATTENGRDLLTIGVYEVSMDPEAFLNNQVLEKQNAFFATAKNFSSIRNDRVGGVAGKAIDCDVTMLGSNYKSTVYAAQVSVGMCFVIRCNKVGTTATQSKSVLASLKFKDNVAVENKPLSVRLEETSQMITKNKPMIGEDLQMTAMNVENRSKTLVYVYKMLNISTADIDPTALQSSIEGFLIDAFAEDIKTSSLVREAAEAGYTFSYRFVDKNDKQICFLKLTYSDYKHLLR